MMRISCSTTSQRCSIGMRSGDCGGKRSDNRCGLLLLLPICFKVCVFRGGILHTLVVTSGYFSYCCLFYHLEPVCSSPLTPDIKMAFLSTQLPLTGYFLFFGPFPANPEMVVHENPGRSAVSEILRPARLAPTTMPVSKSLKSPFFSKSSPRLDASMH